VKSEEEIKQMKEKVYKADLELLKCPICEELAERCSCIVALKWVLDKD